MFGLRRSADCGSYERYDASYDRVTVKKPVVLESQEASGSLAFVSATRDPFLAELATQKVANVYATDVALAHLLVATRSQLSW